MKKLSHLSERIVGQSMFQILEKAKELERQGRELIHFEIGDTYLEMPQEVKNAAILSLSNGRTHYGNSQGEQSLLLAIQKAVKEDFFFTPSLSQITVASGANPLIFYVLSVLVNPGEEVILSDPSFVTYNAVLNMLDIKGVHINITHKDNFRFDPKEIEERITDKTRVIVINSPSNPTGAVYSKEDIIEIYRLAKKHNIYILSDEIYSRLVYEGEHFSPGVLDECKERVIVTNGFSKPFAMTGWRVGYAVGPEEIIKKISLLSQTIVSCVPPFLQDACVVAMDNRHKFAQRYSSEYRKQRDIVCEELRKVDKFEFSKPSGAFYIMIDVSKTGMDGDEFTKYAMEREGVVVCPGSGFGPGGKNYIRLCYANSEKKLREGCRRLSKAATGTV
ncbi:MAG: Arginine--pyruvate transaminase AruH [Candidatus Parcubacteria bacterium]|jgi:aspartate/methionine/tyrosine aminotransferase